MELVEVSHLVTDVGDMFENDLKSRGIELIVDTPLPAVNCEKARLPPSRTGLKALDTALRIEWVALDPRKSRVRTVIDVRSSSASVNRDRPERRERANGRPQAASDTSQKSCGTSTAR